MKDEEDEKRRDKMKENRREIRLWLSGFFFKITRPSNNFEFSKLPVTNPEHDFLPGNFLFVRLHIKIIFELFW